MNLPSEASDFASQSHSSVFDPRSALSHCPLDCVGRMASITGGYKCANWPGSPCPVFFCLVVRNLPSGPWDRAEAGAGPPGLCGTRGRPSGELADLNGPAAPREVALIFRKMQVQYSSFFPLELGRAVRPTESPHLGEHFPRLVGPLRHSFARSTTRFAVLARGESNCRQGHFPASQGLSCFH